MRKQLRALIPVTILGLISIGCVPTEKYTALRIASEGKDTSLSNAQSAAAAAEAKAASYKAQLDAMNNGLGSKDALNNNLVEQNTQLRAQLEELTRRFEETVARAGQAPALPTVVTTELTKLADQNPDIISFDPKTGIMKFKSDLTFASGDAQLQPAAAGVLTKFATILNSGEASKYQLLVEGHADNQPVSAGTVQRGHKDNWYLSSHRALSVAEALRRQSVDGRRIGAVGYGEMRPVASNDSKEGKAMNRRVEVVILPTKVSDNVTLQSPATPVSAAPAQEPVKVKIERPEQSK